MMMSLTYFGSQMWPELAGGFIAYMLHLARHRLYHGIYIAAMFVWPWLLRRPRKTNGFTKMD